MLIIIDIDRNTHKPENNQEDQDHFLAPRPRIVEHVPHNDREEADAQHDKQ